MTLTSDELRSVLRKWASGVTIVTTAHEGVLHGMTVSSFSSVSLEPPLVSLNIERRTRTHALMNVAGVFGVSILARDQKNLALRFGGGVPDLEERLKGVEYHLSELGIPLLDGCLANLECSTHSTLPAGTHTVFVGEVLAWNIQDGKDPLVYWQRQFGVFKANSS